MALKSLESDLPKKPRDCNSRKPDLSQWWLSCRSSQRTWKLPQKAGQNERSSCLTLNKCERKPGKCQIVVMRSSILIVQKLRKQLWWSCILIIRITCILPFGHPPAGPESLLWKNNLHINLLFPTNLPLDLILSLSDKATVNWTQVICCSRLMACCTEAFVDACTLAWVWWA